MTLGCPLGGDGDNDADDDDNNDDDMLLQSKTTWGLCILVVIGTCVGAFISPILFLLSICFVSRRKKPSKDYRSTSGKRLGAQELTHGVSFALDHRSAFPPAISEIQTVIGKPAHRWVPSGRLSSHASGSAGEDADDVDNADDADDVNDNPQPWLHTCASPLSLRPLQQPLVALPQEMFLQQPSPFCFEQICRSDLLLSRAAIMVVLQALKTSLCIIVRSEFLA